MNEIKRDQSHQYLIGYTSYKDDRPYQEIKVVTTKGKYRVRTRQGY